MIEVNDKFVKTWMLVSIDHNSNSADQGQVYRWSTSRHTRPPAPLYFCKYVCVMKNNFNLSKQNNSTCHILEASTDEDGRLRIVYPSIRPCGQWIEIWAHWTISWTNSDVGPRLSFEGGRMDRFFTWTVHLLDELGRWTKIIILRLTSGRIFDSMDGFGRRTINITTRWMEVDEWTGKRMKQTERWTGDPLFFVETIFN